MKKFNSILAVVIFLMGLGLSSNVFAGTVYVRKAPPVRKTVVVKPVRPSKNAVWANGHWGWKNDMHVWIDGKWMKPKKHHLWIDGHWKKTGRGWVWIQGHWVKK